MADTTLSQHETQRWRDQGYAPDQMDLWIMLCGYLDLKGGQHAIGILPKVLYPLLLDQPEAVAVRRWFGARQALPVEERADARVALLPDWRERLQRMRELEYVAYTSRDYVAFGFLPWYFHLDFPDDGVGEQGE